MTTHCTPPKAWIHARTRVASILGALLVSCLAATSVRADVLPVAPSSAGASKQGGENQQPPAPKAPVKAPVTTADSASKKAADALLPSLDNVEVIKVRRLNRKVQLDSAGPRADDVIELRDDSVVTAGMDDIVVLVVKHLDSLVRYSKCLGASGARVAGCTTQPIVLYLDGRAIIGLEPESGAPIPKDSIGTLQFHLERTEKSDEAWADLLGAPPIGNEQFFLRPTHVSAGLANGYPMHADKVYKHFSLRRIQQRWFWLTVVVYLAIFIAFVFYTRMSDIVRDMGPDPDPVPHPKVRNGLKKRLRPYSLARVQMAWWFFWVVGGFFFIFSINRSYEILTGTALALIGISAATLLGSVALDSDVLTERRRTIIEQQRERARLKAKLDELKAEIAQTPPAAATALLQQQAAVQIQHKEADTKLKEAELRGEIPASAGFLKDILADPQGQSFHRFQMIVWTIVLTVLFVVSVYRRLAMPEFNATLLGLLGISNGVYLGFKFPERKQVE